MMTVSIHCITLEINRQAGVFGDGTLARPRGRLTRSSCQRRILYPYRRVVGGVDDDVGVGLCFVVEVVDLES